MWSSPGNQYVYLIYGLHHLLNIITEKEGFPAGILIRSGKIINVDAAMSSHGAQSCQTYAFDARAPETISRVEAKNSVTNPILTPAKLTQYLGLTRADTGINIVNNDEIFIADLSNSPTKISTSPRIGINYASEPWKSIYWRFFTNN